MTINTARETAGAGGAWGVLSILCVAVVLSMTAWFSATAVLPDLQAAWGLPPSTLGWLTNAVQVGFVSGALLASLFNLPDIVSLGRLMAIASVLVAAANAVLLLEPDAGVAILCRFATGFCLAGVYPPAMKLIATWFQRNRGLAFGAIVGALTLGSAMPHLFRGLVGGLDWRLVIALSSLSALVSGLIFLTCARGAVSLRPRHLRPAPARPGAAES